MEDHYSGGFKVLLIVFTSQAFGWTCIEPVQKVFCKENQQCTMHFNVAAYTSSESSIFQLAKYDGTGFGGVYFSGSTAAPTAVSGTNLTADTTRNIWLTLLSVKKLNAGTYVVQLTRDSWPCVTMFILGIPTTPSISIRDPSVGENVTLTCQSTSTTTPSNHSLSLVYNWRVDGVGDPSGPRYTYSASRRNLTLSSVVKDDTNKQFTCTSTENVTDGYTSANSNAVSVFVLYGPENMAFSPSTTSYELGENTEFPQVICSAACNPACRFQWIKQPAGRQVSNNNVLQLENLEASEAGIYRCIATRSGSVTNSKDLTVNVIYGPYPNSTTLSPAETVHTVNENEVLPAITCHADCYPDCSYTWTKYRDGSTSNVYRTDVLDLGTVNRTDAAKYVCSAVNKHKLVNSTTQKEVIINVNYGPDNPCYGVSSVQTFTEGDRDVSIRCFSECYPSCSYTWSNSGGFLSKNETLVLGSVSRYQAGNYTFSASNAELTYSKTFVKIFTVVVMYAPVVAAEFSSTDHLEGSPLTLFCRGDGVPPNYIYTGLTQSVGGVFMPNENTALEGTETNSSIHFSKLQLQDTGNYTCIMNNGIIGLNRILDQTGTVQLLVKVKPKILKDDLKYAGAQGNPVTVQVPFYCYPAVQSVTFIRYDGIVIQNSTEYRMSIIPGKVKDMFYGKEVSLNGYIAVLTIIDPKEEDFANYTLTVHNSRGTTSEIIFILAESIPSIPKGFFLSSAELLFIWEKGFNGGHLQTFIIQVSADGKEKWQNLSTVEENQASYQVNNTFYSIKLKTLDPGTYWARLIAANSLGETLPLYLNTTFTVMSDESTTGSPSQIVAAAAGGSISALVLLIVVGGVIIMWRRRAENYEKETSKLQLKNRGTDVPENNSDDEDVEVKNPMYVSAGPQNKSDDTDTVYAKASKKSKAEATSSDVCAVVKKPKAASDIHENAPKPSEDTNTYVNAAFESDPYETTEISAKAKKSTNEDGLMYVDIAFSKTRKVRKLVIHGLDDRTPYAQVDFTKHAEPLPESDIEEPEQTPKN